MRRGLAALAFALPPLAAQAQEPSGQVGDPNIDRAWFSPTALTQPRGSLSFNDYELVFLGLTYGVSDNFQLTAVVLPPYTSDVPFAGLISGKVGVAVGERVHVAGSLALGMVSDDGDTVTAGVAGASISYCTDAPCASLASLYVYAGFSLDGDDDAIPVGYGGSLVQKVGRHVKLVLDVGSGGALASDEAVFAEGAIVGYGLRFFSDDIAGDVGFMRPVFFNDDDEGIDFILGFPVVTFSYRW